MAANLGLQERLKETLDVLEDGISANADQQAKIQAAAITMNRSGWYTGLRSRSIQAIWILHLVQHLSSCLAMSELPIKPFFMLPSLR